MNYINSFSYTIYELYNLRIQIRATFTIPNTEITGLKEFHNSVI